MRKSIIVGALIVVAVIVVALLPRKSEREPAPPRAAVSSNETPLPAAPVTVPTSKGPAPVQPVPATTNPPSLPALAATNESAPSAPAAPAPLTEDQKLRLAEYIGEMAEKGTSHSNIVAMLDRMFAEQTNSRVKAAILDEMTWLGDAPAFDGLLRAYQSETPGEVQEAAADGLESVIDDLSESPDAAAFDRLVRALGRDLPQDVRSAAIDALMTREDKRAVQHLRALLNDPDPIIREDASDAIEWLVDF